MGKNYYFVRGKKFFELSNHLGNVLATVSDRKTGISLDSATVNHYEAVLMSAQEYYPFGVQMPGRGFSSSKYRYGFNGKENDDEVKGEGNQQDYGMRVYDPRIGKFLSVDPLTTQYPELTPYQFASNTPIQGIDLDGEEVKFVTLFDATQNGRPLYQVETQFGIATKTNMTVIKIHMYRAIDAQGNYHSYPSRPSPFIDRIIDAPTSTGNGPGQFNYSDGVAGLQLVLNTYGSEMAKTVERMYTWETTSRFPKKYGKGPFTSAQYVATGTGGMEVKPKNENKAPAYGWGGQSLYTEHPEYTPLGFTGMNEGPGMSGHGGNKQKTDGPKHFIIFPSVEAAMMYKVNYIERYNGNWARWGAEAKPEQDNYRKTVGGVKPRIVDSLMKALENKVQVTTSTK